MFPEVDTLPCAQGERSVKYRNREAAPRQRGLNVRRHIIRPLGGMRKVVLFFWHEGGQPSLEIASRRRISILLNDKTCRSMGQKEVRKPRSVLRGHGTSMNDGMSLIGDFVESLTLCRDSESGVHRFIVDMTGKEG